MKSIVLTVLIALVLAVILAGCNMMPESVTISVGAKLADDDISNSARAVTSGTGVDVIDAYRVVFKKIEIGNSEEEKYILWENENGETKDIAASISFDDVQPIPEGTYQFVRLTIGDTLEVDGSIIDGETTYTGTGSAVLDGTVYLWGSGVENDDGESTLTDDVVISNGGSLSFVFDIEGTVTYLGGDADNAVLSVEKPVLTLE